MTIRALRGLLQADGYGNKAAVELPGNGHRILYAYSVDRFGLLLSIKMITPRDQGHSIRQMHVANLMRPSFKHWRILNATSLSSSIRLQKVLLPLPH
jgi:hypothetical protein